jgi:hypothetical protein
MRESDAVISRIRRRMFILGGVEIAGALLFGWRAVLSLTIAAAVVIFSFLVFERLTDRLGPREADTDSRHRFLTTVPLLLVTIASLVLFGIVLFRWKGFDPIAGAVGLSTALLAIVPEAVRGALGRE